MRKLERTIDSAHLSLQYVKQSHRPEIKAVLEKTQLGTCAYSEMVFSDLETPHIEHFDDELKPQPERDNIHNWYLVIPQMNHKKPKISKHRPIRDPNTVQMNRDILFRENIFVPARENDTETQNLINFLGVNDEVVYNARKKHIKVLKTTIKDFAMTRQELKEYLMNDRKQLSFATAIEHELEIEVDPLLKATYNQNDQS